MSAAEVIGLVASELAEVEHELASRGRTGHGAVDTIYGHLLGARGKRLRPALLLLAAHASGSLVPRAIRLATIVELIHTATLVHDDVIDNASLRRGIASVNARWSNPVAVLMGDWLYVDSFAQAVRERDFDVLDVLTALTRGLLEGELSQLATAGDPTLTPEAVLGLAAGKTGHLFAGCTELGAIAGGAGPRLRRALHRYGMALGIAFQVIDDILDLTGTDNQLGKPAMADMQEGHVTLAVVYARERCSDGERALIDRICRERWLEPGDADALRDIVAQTSGLERARKIAAQHAAEAVEHLEALPPSRYRDALENLAMLTLQRSQ